MTDQTPDFTSPLAGRIEVRQPCPWCGDRQMIPRHQFDEHVMRLHPDVTTVERRTAAGVAPATDQTACPHCPDGHTPPDRGSQPWSAWVADIRDGDGQPMQITVARSAGAHVAESDAQWVRERLNAPATDQNRQFLTTLANLGIATHRLDRIRDAARLHRQQLIGTSELYAVIEADDTPPATDQTERRDRYGEVLRRWGLLDEVNDPDTTETFAVTALLAVADAEQTELQAEVAELERKADGWREQAFQNSQALAATEALRLTLSEALGLGTGAPWDAIHERAAELRRLADGEQP